MHLLKKLYQVLRLAIPVTSVAMLIMASCIAGHADTNHGAMAKPAGDRLPPLVLVVDNRPAFRVDSPLVHDVDTLSDGTIRLPWSIAIIGKKIRADYDGWEISRVRQTVTITEEELRKGKLARDELVELLRHGTLYISLPDADIDPWDRLDAIWWYRDQTGSITRIAAIAKQKKWLRTP